MNDRMDRKKTATGGRGKADIPFWARALHSGRCHSVGLLVVVLATVLGFGAPTAIASQTRHLTGTSFGPDGVSGIESFVSPQSIAVDQATGDIYVLDQGTEKIYKFDSTGQSLAFSSTGTNAISFFRGITSPDARYQIALAPAGSPGGTGGDIYVAAYHAPGVSVYAASGQKVGEFGPENTCGVTIDPVGRVFIDTDPGTISEYVPSGNPPTDADLFATGANNGAVGVLCNLGEDGSGKLYAANLGGRGIYRLDGIDDTNPIQIDPSAPTLAVDPATGNVLADRGGEVVEYGAGGETRLGAFGGGQLSESHGIAVDGAANQVYVADRGSRKVKVFGAPVPVPTVTVGEALTPTPPQAVLPGTVDPEGLPVTECFYEYGTTQSYGQTAPCEPFPPTSSEPDPVTASISGLGTDGVTYHFRLVASNSNGSERSSDQTLVTAPTVATEPAGPVGETSVTVHGKVFPNELQYSECTFEYGLISHAGFEGAVPCMPSAGDIPADASFHDVSADLTGLHSNNATYRFRLVATNAHGRIAGTILSFTTSGEPQLSEVRSNNADQGSANLEGTIDPSGYGTTYRIEWGATDSYGAIAASGSIKATAGPTRVSTRIGGLTAGVRYHYRVVATNRIRTVASIDREVEALNACGLPDGRCFELVSPRESGPIATPGSGHLKAEMAFQSASNAGALAYVSEGGLPGATQGAEVLYKAARGADGWTSTQFSPPITVRDETQGIRSISSRTLGLSSDLDCGFVESNQPLSEDSGTRLVRESGGRSLYRHNRNGTYTAVSAVPPENPAEAPLSSFGAYFNLIGFSNDCHAVIFTSVYRYPGTGAVGSNRLYEWDEGTLRLVGMVPGPSGEVPVEAVAGGEPSDANQRNDLNAVSEDGSRVFFTAGLDENERPAIFVREDGMVTREISQSETATPDQGAHYQYATPDGSRVYFTANAGLTGETSDEGVDLYEYDLEKGAHESPLTDLSVARGQDPAEVVGVLGAAESSHRVYFAALGQLVPGKGLPLSENQSQGTYSLYTELSGHIAFVATIGLPEGKTTFTSDAVTMTSRVSPDGRFLLFESTTPVTTYESGGAPEAYLFDAMAGAEAIQCISCRPDGRPSAAGQFYNPLPSARVAAASSSPSEPLSPPRSLTMASGEPSVTFSSLDPLALGAAEGDTGLYEWSHGQVFLISAEPSGMQSSELPAGTFRNLNILGADADGSDLYFSTPKSLTWEDGDERFSVYDARIGGGFTAPRPEPPPCSPTSEGSCRGPTAVQGPALPGSGSSSFVGPGNPKKKHHKKKHHKKKHHKKKHHKKKHQGQSNGRSGR